MVYTCSEGNRIEAHRLRTAFMKGVITARIDAFRFHGLRRHTFATRLVQSGIDIYKVQKLLGHRDVKTTQRYAHQYPESLRDGVDILDTPPEAQKRLAQF